MAATALVAAAALMGLAGLPHCAAMCAAPCAAATGGRASAQPLFHVARVAGYATVGAVAAAGASAPLRLAGAMLALGSAWALGHGLWLRIAAWCIA